MCGVMVCEERLRCWCIDRCTIDLPFSIFFVIINIKDNHFILKVICQKFS